jgi:hypothetical protein
MPNLSARFSMLREQDDPTTKIGKANDDSVLFPKRASRLNLFGNDGLSDIAEVSSLSHSIRPPFASSDRAASYASTDGYGTDDDASQNGSVMSRAKPGQGNKFFGGRQKIYKIPVNGPAAAKESDTAGGSTTSGRIRGRAVYDDDVSVTEFQVMKERKSEESNEQATTEADQDDERASTDRRGSPPPYGYNQDRETTSSTTSGPFYTRASTAATSVASSIYGASHTNSSSPVNPTSALKLSSLAAAVPERTIPKGKRMYGHGLDQQIHDQQSSAVSRLDSLQQRKGHAGVLSSKRLSQSRSASNLNDRFRGTGPLYASTNFRAGSPPPNEAGRGLGGFDLGLATEKRSAVGRSPPSMSPEPQSPILGSSVLVASLEPNDVGKATALGAFNKPKAQYNEQQYTQRQMQLLEGRETPPLRSPSSADAYSERSGRLRNDSFTSVQSGQPSKSYQSSTSDRLPAPSAEQIKSRSRPAPFDPYQATNGTFLANMSGSDSSQTDSSRDVSPEPQTVDYSTSQVPSEETPKRSDMFRETSKLHSDPGGRDQTASNKPTSIGYRSPAADANPEPTGVVSDAGLSGLVRTHLRNQSGTSSVYPDSPPPEPEDRPDLPQHPLNYDFEGVSNYLVGKGNYKWTGIPNPPITPVLEFEDVPDPAPLTSRARQMLEQATQLKNNAPKTQPVGLGMSSMGKAQQILGGEAPQNSGSPVTPWQEQVKARHNREGSTETTREREEFANELADRRRRVQENLQSFADSESRSSSPRSGRFKGDNSPSRTPGAITLLKKASKGSLVGRNETSSKAMKMLGISSPHGMGVSPYQSEEDLTKKVDTYASRGVVDKPMFSAQSNVVAAGSGPSFRDRSIGAERRNKFHQLKISPPVLQGGHSGSDALNDIHPLDRPPIMNGHVEPQHVNNNTSYQPSASFGNSQLPRKYSPPRRFDPITDRNVQPRSQSALSNRSRSNSRGGPTGYFDGKLTIQPPYQSNYPAAIGRTPRASPVAPYAAHTTPPVQDIAPAPTMLTGSSSIQPGSRPIGSRKRSINKHDISEPTFINSTSSVTTVALPLGASLSNGMDPIPSKPPVPPINPRRKRTIAAQNVLTAFSARRNDDSSNQEQQDQNGTITKSTVIEQYEETSTFSADEEGPRAKGSRYRLRKTSSEGGNLAARARHQALMAERDNSPAMPSTPVGGEGGAGRMF